MVTIAYFWLKAKTQKYSITIYYKTSISKNNKQIIHLLESLVLLISIASDTSILSYSKSYNFIHLIKPLDSICCLHVRHT